MNNSEQSGKTKNFIIIALLVIVSRLYDVFTTYLYIPDLEGETNILVKFFGAGWTTVIIFQSLLVGLTVFLLFFYFFKFKPDYPTEKGLSLKQFASFLYFNNTNSFNKLFYKTPNNKRTFFASIGYVVSMTLLAVGFVVGTSTTLLILSDTYKQLYKNGIFYFLFAFMGIIAIWFYYRFFKIEHNKYKK
ncbi:MAG: hypothetical protein HND27_10745 [Bacteroidetes bacterium]|nr:hypothetical protein [Bacteroidota bacterium]NOG96239.1 hypothetical protein [Bacteroidota bacterium]